MRYDVNKYLFVGFEGEREDFFQKAQDSGIVHFIRQKTKKSHHVPEDVANIMQAIKIIKTLPPTPQEEIEAYPLADGLAEKVLQLHRTQEQLSEEERILNLEMSRVQIFGDFALEDVAYIESETGCKIQYYCAKVGFADLASLPPELIFIGSDHALDYFAALNSVPKQYAKMIEIHIERPFGILKKRLNEIKESLHQNEQRLKVYAKYNKFFHHALINKLNQFHLGQAKESVKKELDGSLYVIEGWVPVTKEKELVDLAEKANIHIEQIAIEPQDVIPTYLENTGATRLGEDLIQIYDTPSHSDKDPSLWVLIFFSLFFAIIIGDAGYGLIFLGAALYVRYKYTLDKTWTRVVNLFTILSAAVIVWGILTTSFFGISVDLDSPIRKVSLIQWLVEKKTEYIIQHQDADWKGWVAKFPQLATIKNPKEFLKLGATQSKGKADYVIYNKFADNVMFELALMIGVIHIILSMLRYIRRNWNGLGWIIFIIGCYLYLPSYLQATSIIHFVFGVDPVRASQNGLYLMLGGLILATAFSIAQNKWTGLLEPMAIGSIFADAMSYLRLYALGLSGAMLTTTINDLASGWNFVVAFLITVAGHGVNMILSIMGGTIHGLRLNFLEWYHYSFEGGGKPFDPLRKMEIE